MNVVTLEEAAGDIETGKRFYDSCEQDVGNYFVDSILSDIESLVIYAGIHSVHFGRVFELTVVERECLRPASFRDGDFAA